MNNQLFSVGDKVRCIIGGPEMLVSHITVQNAFVLNQFANNGQHAVQQQRVYTCMWFNAVSGMFQQWNFNENMLEDVK